MENPRKKEDAIEYKAFLETLRNAIDSKRITGTEISKRTGVKQPQLSNAINHGAYIGVGFQMKICEAIGVDYDLFRPRIAQDAMITTSQAKPVDVPRSEKGVEADLLCIDLRDVSHHNRLQKILSCGNREYIEKTLELLEQEIELKKEGSPAKPAPPTVIHRVDAGEQE